MVYTSSWLSRLMVAWPMLSTVIAFRKGGSQEVINPDLVKSVEVREMFASLHSA